MSLVCGVPRKMQGCGGSRSTEGDTIQMSGEQCGRMSQAKIHPWDCNAKKFSIGRERPCKTRRLPAPSPRHPQTQLWETEDWVQPSQTTPGLFGHRSPMRTAVLAAEGGRGVRHSRRRPFQTPCYCVAYLWGAVFCGLPWRGPEGAHRQTAWVQAAAPSRATWDPGYLSSPLRTLELRFFGAKRAEPNVVVKTD